MLRLLFSTRLLILALKHDRLRRNRRLLLGLIRRFQDSSQISRGFLPWFYCPLPSASCGINQTVLMATARVSLCRFLHLPFLYVVRVDLLLACACLRHIPSILASIHRFNRRGTLHCLRCVPLSSASKYDIPLSRCWVSFRNCVNLVDICSWDCSLTAIQPSRI